MLSLHQPACPTLQQHTLHPYRIYRMIRIIVHRATSNAKQRPHLIFLSLAAALSPRSTTLIHTHDTQRQ